ncbi:hypothetical protein [Haloarcula litorea]|uniref:hypothetical protein n=1 Tax=Haloarcula litorea TaxID=3032579 RepID=UPI0023E854E3|nr:hypothetical protein [Halomicroarcula sp. GDY20]
MNRPTDTPNAAARTVPAPEAALTLRGLLAYLGVLVVAVAFLTAPLATATAVTAVGLCLLADDTVRRLRASGNRRSADGRRRPAEPTAD